MSFDMVIFWLVVGARFGVPLFIPRYPLPAIIAALVLDGIDQTIFQTFTQLPLDGYQSYDKALDVYYLVIAYIATLRNWTHHLAFRVSRFLIYYRLVGVVLFELLSNRALLLIFPNTFEYFFIFYETVALRWNPIRMSRRLILGVAAFIWIVIKLPQEYWIHVAQMDATEFLNEHLFGVPADASIVQSFFTHPEITLPLVGIAAGLIGVAYWVITRKLPMADWSLSFKAQDHIAKELEVSEKVMTTIKLTVDKQAVMEKIALLSLVMIIFAQILPGVRATELQMALGVAFVAVINTGLSYWLTQQGKGFASMVREFGVMAVVNFGLALVYIFLLPTYSGGVNMTNTLFFALLLTLLVMLYDAYRPVYVARFFEKI